MKRMLLVRLLSTLLAVIVAVPLTAAVRFGEEVNVTAPRTDRMQSLEDGVFNGTDFLMIWRDWSPFETARPLMAGRFGRKAERLDQNGVRLLRDRNVASAVLAHDGSRYLLVWNETIPLGSGVVRHSTFAVVLSLTLTEVGSRAQIGSGFRTTDLLWNGKSFIAVMVMDEDGSLQTLRLGSDGKTQGMPHTVLSGAGSTDAALALGKERIMLASREASSIRFVPLSTEGARSGNDSFSASVPANDNAAIASHGDGFAAVWQRSSVSPVVAAQLFDSKGAPSGNAFDLPGAGRDPSIVYDGELYIVSSRQATGSAQSVRAQFLSPGRVVVRQSAAPAPNASDAPLVIPGGTRHLLAYENSLPSLVDQVVVRSMDDSTDHTPAMPQNLVATYLGGGRGRLTWSDVSDNETGFAIERRRADEVSFVHIATLLPNTTEYEMTDLLDGVNYVFRMRSFTSGGYSGYTNQVLMTSCPQPSTPSSFGTTLVTSDSIRVSWVSTTTSEHEVELELVDESGVSVVRRVPGSSNSAEFVGLVPQTLYTIRVRAISACGASARFEITAKTYSVRRRPVKP